MKELNWECADLEIAIENLRKAKKDWVEAMQNIRKQIEEKMANENIPDLQRSTARD